MQFNKVLITGDVAEISATQFTVSTARESRGIVYTEKHSIQCSKAKRPSWLKVGAKIAVKGELVNKGTSQMIKPFKMAQAEPEDEYLNLVRLIGEVIKVRHLPASPDGKRPTTNVDFQLTKAGVFHTSMWGTFATAMKRMIRKGAAWQFQGMLHARSYVDYNGSEHNICELWADEDETEMKSEAPDLFADDDEADVPNSATEQPAF